MALNRQQERIYTKRFDIWRPTRVVTAGKPGAETYTRVATRVYGRYGYTENVSDQSPAGRIKRAMLFTMDRIFFAVGTDARDGDLVHGVDSGEWHRLEGAPMVTNQFTRRPGNRLSFRATTLEKPPAGVG